MEWFEIIHGAVIYISSEHDLMSKSLEVKGQNRFVNNSVQSCHIESPLKNENLAYSALNNSKYDYGHKTED